MSSRNSSPTLSPTGSPDLPPNPTFNTPTTPFSESPSTGTPINSPTSDSSRIHNQDLLSNENTEIRTRTSTNQQNFSSVPQNDAFDPSHLISLNLNPLMSHLQYMTKTIQANQQRMTQMERDMNSIRIENEQLKQIITEERSAAVVEKKEEKVKEDMKGNMRLIAKRMCDDVKAEFEMQMHKMRQMVEGNVKELRETIEESATRLREYCDAQVALSREEIEQRFKTRLEELRTLISNMKDVVQKETTNMIIEKKSEIVKESFDSSGILNDLNKCREEVRNITAVVKQLDEDFMDRVKRITKGELKMVKQNTVRTIMKETTAQQSRLKYYVRNLYAMLRLDMRRLDDIINDYELMEHTNPEALRGSMLLQKKCMGVIVAPRRTARKQSHSEAEGAQQEGENGQQQGEGAPDTTTDAAQDEDAEDAEIRVTPGVAVALEYIYQRTPFNSINQKHVSIEVENLNKNIGEAVEKTEREFTFQIKHIEKILESKVSKLLLSESLKDNDVIQGMNNEFIKVRDHVMHILDHYMTREQIYACLRQKADVTLMNLKADRKFLNGVFDYLNEKITLLSTESNSQELMISIKKLESKLKDLTQSGGSVPGALNTSMGIASGLPANSASQLFSLEQHAGSTLPGINASVDQGMLGSTRCLSCNRSYPPNMQTPVAQKSKWLDYPPSSIPHMPSVYQMDTSRRLESYRHWITKGEKSAMEMTPPPQQQDESFLGGGFKHITPIRPTSASSGAAAARGHTSISFTSTDSSLGMGQLNVSMPTPPVTAPSGARGKINKSRQQKKAPQSARGALQGSRMSKLTSNNAEMPAGITTPSESSDTTTAPMPDYLKSKVDYTSMALGETEK